jgi:hypothetical protein
MHSDLLADLLEAANAGKMQRAQDQWQKQGALSVLDVHPTPSGS